MLFHKKKKSINEKLDELEEIEKLNTELLKRNMEKLASIEHNVFILDAKLNTVYDEVLKIQRAC